MHMIFKGCHYFVLIEIRDPMEQSVQVTSRVPIERLTSRIYRNMIVDKLNLISILFESIDHIIFLISS